MNRILLGILFLACSFQTITVRGQSDNPNPSDSLFALHRDIYIKFSVQSKDEIAVLTRFISIDNVRQLEVWAFASQQGLEKLSSLGYAYETLPVPGSDLNKLELQSGVINKDKNGRTIWNSYPTYDQYIGYMTGFASTYPDICKLDTVGTSNQNRLILALRISKNVNIDEPEPQFLYTSSIHGDEIAGYVLMLHLIDTLLSSYGVSDRITDMIDSNVIVINPLANPDGTFHGGNDNIGDAWRGNAYGVDLNRNFPDPNAGPHPDGNSWQTETVAWMAYADNNRFTMSANFHGGAEVFNYPWDTWAKLHADDSWWQFVGREWADTCHEYSPSGYFNDQDNGVTNGYAWYEINGGRQDYMNYYQNCREVTLEISGIKMLPVSQLLNWWRYNYHSFFNYIEQASYGFNGIVTDTVTNEPVAAKILIPGHDIDNSYVFSHLPSGYYARPVDEGTFDATFSATGYYSKTIKNISISHYTTTHLDVQLKPLTYGIKTNEVKTALVYPNPGRGCIQILLPDQEEGLGDIEIWNSSGKSVFKNRFSVPAGQNTLPINLEKLPSGLYMILLYKGNTRFQDKFIIQ